MNSNGIINGGIISSVSGNQLGPSGVDLMAYVETLLVQDYNNQMRDLASNIKRSTKLKEFVRNHKSQINALLGNEAVDNGKKRRVSAEEYTRYKSKPNIGWDEEKYDGMGGVAAYYQTIAANEEANWHGDPHYNDADSKQVGFGHTDFDFHGVNGHEYLYFQDGSLRMTAKHDQKRNTGRTFATEIRLSATSPNNQSTLYWRPDRSPPLLDGVGMDAGKTYQLADGGRASFNGNKLVVTSADGYVLQIQSEGGYFNGTIKSGPDGVMKDGVPPTGILGSQFDADKNASQVNGEMFDLTTPPDPNTVKPKGFVDVDPEEIKAEVERLQGILDNLNSETELAQTELSTLTSQRKIAFEALSTMLSKIHEASSTIIRNIK